MTLLDLQTMIDSILESQPEINPADITIRCALSNLSGDIIAECGINGAYFTIRDNPEGDWPVAVLVTEDMQAMSIDEPNIVEPTHVTDTKYIH